MTTKRWDFRDEDQRSYSVELEHAVLTGDRRIIVNGREVFRGGKFVDTGGGHTFDVDGHRASLRIGTNGFAYTYQLVIGGLTIPPEGATIPRAPRRATADVVSAPEADRVPAEQPAVAAVAQAPDRAAPARIALVKRVENGGRWFYWIAGLSSVNLVFFFMGSSKGFALGTAIDWLFQGVLEKLAGPSVGWIAHVAVIALFVLLGVRATAGAQWAFIVGALVYTLDGVLFLIVGDWIGIAVHAFALFAIVSGMVGLRRLRGTPLTVPAV